MTHSQVIIDSADLTPEKLTAMLMHRGMLHTGVVTGVDEVSHNATHVSTRYHLAVTYTPDAMGATLPTALFLKVSQPSFPLPHPFGEAEPRFYNELVPMMAATPTLAQHFIACIDAAFSPDLQQYHTLLVDVSATHYQTDGHVPPSFDLCAQLFDLYAQLSRVLVGASGIGRRPSVGI